MSGRADVLAGIADGLPRCGPETVHVDVTNGCNAACVTCWDHSPLLDEPRSAEWKRRRMPLTAFRELCEQLEQLGSVSSLILSGMGEPLIHPDIYEMIALASARSWQVTLITNLVAADIDRLAASGVAQLLVGVHGVTPATYAAFHPGWTERQFNILCSHLRELASAGVRCRQVHVINRDNAAELRDMVRFGGLFGADRVNLKLASLTGGTERCAVTAEQRSWLLDEGIPEARAMAARRAVPTNLDLFERQVRAADGETGATVPIGDVGCFMGYAYGRVTVDRTAVFCCNPAIEVGRLADAGFGALWFGKRWQALRDRLRRGQYFPGCDRCGKFEQNLKWRERFRSVAGEPAWRRFVGAESPGAEARPGGVS